MKNALHGLLIAALLGFGCEEAVPMGTGSQAGAAAMPSAGAIAMVPMAGTGVVAGTTAGTVAGAGTAGVGAAGMGIAGTGVAGMTPATGGAGGMTPMMGGTGGMDDAGGMAGAAGMAPSSSGLLPTTDVTMDGPYTSMVDQNADGGAAWLFRPSELGANGEKHPVLVWGCGSTSNPMAYMFHLSRIASHGFVVYASISSSVTGAMLTQGIDWLYAQNESGDMAGKLDIEHLAVGGHSLGSLSTYDIADDPRIFTTIHVDGGQFDGMGGQRLMKPAIFICGDDSIAKPNCDADYMGTSVPVFYTQIMGLSGLEGHIQAARQGIDVWVAWMRWQLAGEEERRADFLDPMCTFCTGKYITMSKNW